MPCRRACGNPGAARHPRSIADVCVFTQPGSWTEELADYLPIVNHTHSMNRCTSFEGMLHMEQPLEQRVRERAHEIWNASGREDGRADEQWLSAERELLAILRAQPAVAKTAAVRKARRPTNPRARTARACRYLADLKTTPRERRLCR